MGRDDGPDPLAPGFSQAFRGEAEAGGEPLLMPEPFRELGVGVHSSRLKHRPGGCPATWTASG
jgi:hypothetical protein